MKLQDKQVIIFSHLPKCGGVTIRDLIEKKYKVGSEVIYDSINGYAKMAFSECSPEFLPVDNKFLIIHGHRVSDSLFKELNVSDINLLTMIRHPFKRNVSHFLFRKNNGNEDFNISFKDWSRLKSNDMCRFYIENFPSLIGDIFSSLSDQALNVLSYFKQVSYLEEGSAGFNRLLDYVNLSYTTELRSNVNSKKRFDFIFNDSDITYDTFNYIKQDLRLYSNAKHIQNTRSLETFDFNKVKPRNWLLMYIKSYANYGDGIRDSILGYEQNSIVIDLFNSQNNKSTFDLESLFIAITQVQSYESFTNSFKYNLFFAFSKVINKCLNKKYGGVISKDTFFGSLWYDLMQSNCKNIQLYSGDLVYRFPDSIREKYFGLINIYTEKKDYNSALNVCLDFCKQYPGFVKAFEILLSISLSLNKMELAHKSLMKISELTGARSKNYKSKLFH